MKTKVESGNQRKVSWSLLPPFDARRDVQLDNLKAILIFLVVLGHLIEVLYEYSPLYSALWNIIYSFHMPLFVFVSGYFCKNADKVRETAFSTYLILYLIFNTLFFIIRSRSLAVNLLHPHFVYWYLLCMFFWRLILKDIIQLRYALPLVLAFSLYCGLLDEEVGLFLSLSRAAVFFPYFLAGYFFSGQMREKLRKLPTVVAVVGFAGLSALILIADNVGLIGQGTLGGARGYAEPKLQGLLIRLAMYVVSGLLCLCVLRLTPRRKTLFTGFGYTTLPVFLLHPYFVDIAKCFANLPIWLGLAVSVLLAAGILLLLGNRYISAWMKTFLQWVNCLLFRNRLDKT